MAKVAINGFGRIGRVTLRVLQKRGFPLELVAINDPFLSPQVAAHLVKYDTVYGRAPFRVEGRGGALVVDGQEIPFLAEKDPEKLPWGEYGVEVVIESSGVFREYGKAELHLKAGAKRVLISAPPRGERKEEIPQILWRINEDDFDPGKHRIVSAASCTTNSLGPVVKVLHEAFGIEHGFLTTVHGYTADQRLVDAPHKDLARARAAAANIIPTSTGAARSIPAIFPELKGKMDGIAMRVPVPCGSVSDFTARLKRPVTVDEVNQAFRDAARTPLGEVMLVTEDPIVSSDVLGEDHSAVVALAYTMVLPGASDVVKVLSFYDNEWGYVNRLVDVAAHVAR
ncbi:MAG: Glyceraldehyde 3-phosphate dehydrogenase [Acetothermia bacterium 64_32]|nr:MAG: Glyceraldehyde 3-phosphate dehydrogenase [Acetothermia bacterium 64_32]HAF71402.1 type I glyceraldehyde-3-phosphate dehydrogenase [Candidatus Acetothermia bacterium]